MMYYLVFVLLLLSAVLAEECDLLKLCMEKEPTCWPSSENELEAFAEQFKDFKDLQCVETVLLNKELSFGGGIKQRIRDLANYGCFKKMSGVLVDELYAHEEMPEYLKMIPVATLRDDFNKKRDYKHLIRLIKHQKYYNLDDSLTLGGFKIALFDFLNEDFKNEEFSWLTDPTWIAFANLWYTKDETLTLLLSIGEKVEKSLKDEIKAAFTLTATRFVRLPVYENPSFFENDDRGQKIFDSLKNVIQSVTDDELRSVLEFIPYINSSSDSENVYSQASKYQGFHVIKILWKYLRNIGHKNNAASLIFNTVNDAFRNRCFIWNASKDSDGQEMFAAILNVAINAYEFYDANDVVAMANGFESSVMPAKIKKHEHFLGARVKLEDFIYAFQNQEISEKFYTEEELASIELLMKQSSEELQNTICLLQYETMEALLQRLRNFSSFPNSVRSWYRSYPVRSILIESILSLKPLMNVPISHIYSSIYFLLPYVPFNDLGMFDDGEGSLAASYLFLSDLFQNQAQTLEWLISVRKAMPVLFKLDGKITGAHVELLWTYRLILDDFVKTLELAGEKSDSYILRTILQNLGPNVEIFDRNLENMPLKWTLTVKEFNNATGVIALDPKTDLDNNSKTIPLAEIVKVLAKYFDSESEWEHVADYLRSVDLDFMAVK